MERAIRSNPQRAAALLFRHHIHASLPEGGYSGGLGGLATFNSQGLVGPGPALVKVFISLCGLKLWLISFLVSLLLSQLVKMFLLLMK